LRFYHHKSGFDNAATQSNWIGVSGRGVSFSIIGYLTELRLYRAQSALADSDEKIVNIALDAGFGSMSQFYEIFHRATGLTPQKWRDAQ